MKHALLLLALLFLPFVADSSVQPPVAWSQTCLGRIEIEDDVVTCYEESAAPTATTTPTLPPTATLLPPPPTASSAPTATATTPPNPTATPLPPDARAPYGYWPNCLPPGVPLETHGWWHEPGEHMPRHLHYATCLPNARPDGSVVVAGDLKIVARITLFNSGGELRWVRAGAYPDSQHDPDCPSAVTCVRFAEPLRCDGPEAAGWDRITEVGHGYFQCQKWVEMTIPRSALPAGAGMLEIRQSPNVIYEDLGGNRHFVTNNHQVDFGGGDDYRSSPALISRSWYDLGYEYANVSWKNYIDMVPADYIMPVVGGTIPVEIAARECTGAATLAVYVDPDFHGYHAGISPQPQPLATYQGCGDYRVLLDTTRLSDGRHTIYIQLTEDDGEGKNAGAGAYLIEVRND